ncbi:hypothetical protein [Aquisphaera insulae]|uniref:hypothetical protein n=1 Tax=Aquisphaera insulae TaxID=2712864 RepID=UPI0013ED25DB|nr:hypothetical protein [Aquisphaera insulae]
MTSPKTPFERAMALAALSGFRVALGPAFLAAKRRSPHTGHWAVAALGEMFLDKIGILPPRYRPGLMIPHAISGAWVAQQSMKEEGIHDPSVPVLGAVVAAGVSCVAPLARMALNRGLGVPDVFLGLGEDYLALNLGSEATGISLGQVTEITRDAVEDLRTQVAPSLPPIPSLPAGVSHG